MFHLLQPLIAKLEANEAAHQEAARTTRELIDFLKTLIPNDFRNKPSDLYRPR